MKFHFQSCELDTQCRELKVNGKQKFLAPKAFTVLLFLLENRDRMVSKRELLDTFWSTNVSEAALLKSVSLIRKSLEQNKDQQTIIKTYHGQGYRFVAKIEDQPATVTQASIPLVLTEQRLMCVMSVRFVNPDFDSLPKHQTALQLEPCLNQAKMIVENHQGNVLHNNLDGFSATFGMQKLYEDVARRAIRCSVELIKISKEQGLVYSDFSVRVGISTGLAVLENSTKPLWKPASNIEQEATKLSQKAQAGDILLTQETLKQLQGEIEVEPHQHAFKLVSPPVLRSGVLAREHKSPIAFVGRKAEIAFLKESLYKAIQGKGSAAILCGPAGIGKTRLVSELFIKRQTTKAHWILINCIPSLQNTPLIPVRKLCAQIVKDLNNIELTLSTMSQTMLRHLLHSNASIEAGIKALSNHERRQKSYQMLYQLLCKACKRIPLLIIIEDIHWLDATSEEYLNEIVRYVPDNRLMLLMTTRPVERHFYNETVLNLSPLDSSDCRKILSSNTLASELDEKTSNSIISRSQGNPFFLEELVFAATAGDYKTGHIPDSIQAVISVRIGSLPLELRSLVYIIAVIGSPAQVPIIAHLSGQQEQAVTTMLEQLIALGFLAREMDSYTFRHMLINDTAYTIIAKTDRIDLHVKIADYLEQHNQDNAARPEYLAWHYQQSNNAHKAIGYWAIASREALKRFSYQESVAFAKQGLQLPKNQSKEYQSKKLDLLLLLATALTTLKGFGFSEAGDAYQKAKRLNKKVGTAKTKIHVLVGLWLHNWVLGQLPESLNYAVKLKALADTSKQPSVLFQAHSSIGQVLTHMGKIEQALNHLDSSLKYAEKEPPNTLSTQNVATSCAAYAAWCASLLGRYEQAHTYYLQSIQWSKAFKNPFALTIHYALCAEYFVFIGDVKNCLKLANKAITLSRQHDFKFWLGTGLVLRGWALGQQDQFAKALTTLDEGISVFQTTGAGVQMSNWLGLKAEIELLAGHFSAAVDTAQQALRYANTAEDIHFKPRIHAVAAQLHKNLGNHKQSDLHRSQASILIKRFGINKTALMHCLKNKFTSF